MRTKAHHIKDNLYVIELKDMSATEFFSKYEITKTFDYSNAWQVKKKDGVK